MRILFYIDMIEQGDIFPKGSPTDRGKITGIKGRLFDGIDEVALPRDQSQKDPFGLGGPTKSVGSDQLKCVPETGASYQNVKQQGPGQSVYRKFVPPGFGKATSRGLSEISSDVTQGESRPVKEETEEKRRRKVPVRRGLPRFWEPRDPVILISETRKSYAHGEDGRLADDETLACRLTGETVSSVSVVVGRDRTGRAPSRMTVGPYDITQTVLPPGQIPPEAVKIYEEAVLMDLTSAVVGAESVTGRVEKGELDIIAPPDRYDRDVLGTDGIIEKYQVETTLLWNSYLNPEIAAQGVSSISGIEGTAPLPFSLRPWTTPWTPLHLDWEVEWIPSANLQRDWKLDEHDYEPRAGVDDAATDAEGFLYRGRTLLTPSVSRVLAQQLSKFIEQESNETSDLASDNQERALGQIQQALKNVDVQC